MGRRTWESLKRKPLPVRVNIVLSSNDDFIQKFNNESTDVSSNNKECISFNSFQKALKYWNESSKYRKTFVIGGSKIYAQIVNHPSLEYVYINKIRNKSKINVSI